MGMTDKIRAKTDLRYIDLTVGERVQAWSALRARKDKGSNARRVKRALAALQVDDDLLDDLAELQTMEQIANQIPVGRGEEEAKLGLERHRKAKKKRRAFENQTLRVCVTMENLDVYHEHIVAAEDEMRIDQIDALGAFFEEVENAKAADTEGPLTRYLDEGSGPKLSEVL